MNESLIQQYYVNDFFSKMGFIYLIKDVFHADTRQNDFLKNMTAILVVKFFH